MSPFSHFGSSILALAELQPSHRVSRALNDVHPVLLQNAMAEDLKRHCEGKADPTVIAELFDPTKGGLPAVSAEAAVGSTLSKHSDVEVPISFLYRIVRTDAELEKLGMQLETIDGSWFSNRQDADAVDNLRTESVTKETR